MPLSLGARLGPYEIVAALGAGGMGEVYRARDTRLGRNVAIKILRPQLEGAGERRRLLQEARAVSALNHPHIVTLHDIGEHEGQDYLVMECIEGAPLRERIGPGGLPIGEVLAYAVAIAAGVAAAHTAGILHRDLKPSNILVTADGTVKVVDFGLAKLPAVAVAAEDVTVPGAPTLTGALVGTPSYMSPEQIAAKPLDERGDVFSFGAVLYEMVTGTRAFHRESSTETLVAVLHDEPRAVRDMRPDIPAALERLIQRCLRKDPAGRPARMREVGVLLEDLRETLHTPNERSAPMAPDPGGRQARRPLRAAVAAAAVIALTLLGLGTAWYVSRAPATPLTGIASIVVLPSTVFGDAEFEYLTDAVPATLSTHLAQIDGLDTKVPPSSLDVEQVRGDLGRIASAYGVTAFVVSSVLADRDRLVLNVQLVESRTRRVAWSRQYEGTRQAYINLVNEAADGLRVALRPATASVRVQTAPAAASEAELALRQGQYYSNRYNNQHRSADFNRAFASLQEALQLESTAAQAAAEIAALLLYGAGAGAPDAEVIAEADAWARRALTSDPQNAQAWGTLSWVEFRKADGSLSKMLEYGLRAAALGPRCSTCQMSVVFVGFASVELARAPLRAARALDPLFLYPILNLAKVARDLGQATDALMLLDEALALEPDAPLVLPAKVLTLAALGRLDEAAVVLERLRVHADERRLPILELHTAEHAVARGRADTATADAALAAIMDTVNDPGASIQHLENIQSAVVPVLARTGLVDTAFDIIEGATRAGSIMPYDWFLVNPDLEPLRRDRRFQAVAAQARAQADTLIAILREAQRRGELPDYLEQPLADFRVLLATERGW